MRRNKIMSEGQCSTHEKKRNKFRCPRNARFRAFYDFAAAHRRCVVCISARVLLVVPVPVPVLVPVVLLAPLVCDSTNRAENTPPSYTGPSKNIRRTPTNEPRTKFHLIERISHKLCSQYLILSSTSYFEIYFHFMGIFHLSFRGGSCKYYSFFYLLLAVLLEILSYYPLSHITHFVSVLL